ncbi:MAG: signal peptidase I [Terrisporobacter sp.]|uniref:signal peptidase I n=1 Tax=Terrisporobacter sp. TaxID=1965305 RepID=UPI002FC9249F
MEKKIINEILEWVKTISVSLILAFAITLIVQPTIVNGSSMYPTLETEDYLVVNKLAYKDKVPQRGDIVVFKSEIINDKTYKKKNLVKRVIALPEERIVIENGKVYIDNKELDENYIENMNTEGNVDIVVPKNHIFVMGDNRSNSLDSREPVIGTVSLESVIGKVAIRLYPFNKIDRIK